LRGEILGLSRLEARDRAWEMITARIANRYGELKPIAYRLEGGFNGGFAPGAAHCASWSYGERTPTSDCIGFVLWCSGIDRLQPGYHGTRGEWLNCASLMDDAIDGRKFCRPLVEMGVNKERVLAGDWLLTRDHIGIIVRPDTHGDRHLVADCSPRHGRDAAINLGYEWSDACKVIRPTTLVYPRG